MIDFPLIFIILILYNKQLNTFIIKIQNLKIKTGDNKMDLLKGHFYKNNKSGGLGGTGTGPRGGGQRDGGTEVVETDCLSRSLILFYFIFLLNFK